MIVKDLSIKKLYYSISEVSRLIGEEHYVLRYWETEFDQLKPQKNRAGNRVYTQKDIAVIEAIRRLLREHRYTIEGAKEIMRTDFDMQTGTLTVPSDDLFSHVAEEKSVSEAAIEVKRSQLQAIKARLESALTYL